MGWGIRPPAAGHGNYRPDVDGLRAIAVLAVVLFHAGLGCPGGYVGVDVFFVISGFLITSLIWSDLERGRFTFAGFWERRARRIAPALVVMTAVVLAAGCILLLPADLIHLGRATAAQAAFVANVFYCRDAGYFADASSEMPLLHTWSLAVEEQFYLLVPVVLWALYRFPRLRSRRVVAMLIAIGCLVSLGASAREVVRHPSWAFYLLPNRAWELLLGALVAFVPFASPAPAGRAWRELLPIAGLALILVPVFGYDEGTPFPGLAAIPPCLGTALVLLAGGRGGTSAVGSLLSSPPLVFVGLISYSLYLWHWPFLAFADYLAVGPLPLAIRIGLLAGGFAAAILSWRYVEAPFRERRLGAGRSAMLAYAGAGLAAVLAAGLLVVLGRGLPARFSQPRLELAAGKADFSFEAQVGTEDMRAGRAIAIGDRGQGLGPSVLVWGDSHAMAAMPAFDALLREQGLAGRAAAHSSTAPVLGWHMQARHGLGAGAEAFNDATLAYIRSQRIRDVVLVGYWRDYVAADASGFRSALLATVRRVAESGARPWVMLDVPIHGVEVPKALALPWHIGDLDALVARPGPPGGSDLGDAAYLDRLREAGARVLDPGPGFLAPDGRSYRLEADGAALYRDRQHLTTAGALRALLPVLRTSFTPGR